MCHPQRTVATMQDCPSRHAHHPVLTPAFHHVLRCCDGCDRIGCVVPTCRRHLFDPADEQLHWTVAPASGEALRTWRCISCREVRSTWATRPLRDFAFTRMR